MRRILAATLLLSLLSVPAWADTIKVKVNGMVCAFCATGIEKSFKTQPAVSTVKVDLDKKLVTIGTRDGQTLDDAKVKKLITDAGYSVVSIVRGKNDAPAP